MMKRTIKPIAGETLGAYWRRCDGSFAGRWDLKALKYAIKNGGVVKSMVIISIS